MINVIIGELVEDFDLYPRDQVNTHHIAEIAEAMRQGAEMPPLVIDQKTKVVIDGFHRRRAMVQVYGETHETEVVAKRYKTRGDAFKDALKYNASHGLRFDTHDKITAILKGEKLGVDLEMIGAIIHQEVDKLAKLTNTRVAKANGGLVALKATIRHKAGDKLTRHQIDANKKLSGMNQVFYVNQLITLIESELLNLDDALLMERLVVLRDLLNAMK